MFKINAILSCNSINTNFISCPRIFKLTGLFQLRFLPCLEERKRVDKISKVPVKIISYGISMINYS